MSQFLSAKVKNVLSGDTVVLTPPRSAQVPAPERIFTLQYVRGDSYEAKEFLRQLAIGKEIKFKVLFKIPALGKEFGDIRSPIFDSLIEYLLEKGMVKLKDNVRADSDDEELFVENLRRLEAAAQKQGVGIWAPAFAEPEVVALSELIIQHSQTKPLVTVVEKVISGDRIVGRLIVDATHHVLLPLLLAGIKAPRTDESDPALVKVANDAKKYVEDHLLMSKGTVGVTIIGENQAGLPLAVISHPSGNNIHEKLLENGFAEVVDWQSSLVGSATMSKLRKAEQTAKSLAKGLYASVTPAPVAVPRAAASKTTLRPGATIDNVTVSKIINVDSYNVRLPSGEEITVQLASLRGPKPNDATVTTNTQLQQTLVQQAREFARRQAIGKRATMYIDGFREANKDLNLDSRFLVSLKISGNDLSETIVSNGFATVIKHNKQTSHERSMNWDRLVELEEEQKKSGKLGVFCKGDLAKTLTVSPRVVNASENLSKAKTFFSGFQKKGRISGAHVEFVSAANRVKLYNPREGVKLTLILGGLSNDRNAESGNAGLDFMNKKYLQRNVEFEVYDTDKIGGFIGNLYANAQALVPVQEELLSQGLVAVHELAVSSNPHERAFEKAEAEAKAAGKGIWKGFDQEKVDRDLQNNQEQLAKLSVEAAKPKYFDIEIVDVGKNQILLFHHIDANTSATFARFKKEFNDFHAQNASASSASMDLPIALTKPPKKNDMVSAKFSENGKFYRAKVVNFDRASNKFDVKHVDFGNVDLVPLSLLRVLPKKFALETLKPFAHTCKLQSIELPPNQPKEYLTEALYLLEDLTYDKKLVLSGVPSLSEGVEYDAILYDSEQSLKDPTYTINKQLVSEGFGMVDANKSGHLQEYMTEIQAAEKKAKARRLGCWEFGDIRGEEAF